jgi:hypothetical protein
VRSPKNGGGAPVPEQVTTDVPSRPASRIEGSERYEMTDFNMLLSQLHLRAWQDELKLSGVIDEYGYVEFGQQGLGNLSISLVGTNPGGATIIYKIVEDYFDIGLTEESARDICNTVNLFSSGAMLVDAGATLEIRLHLFYLPLDDTGALPDEGFLRAWIGPAMSEIEAATSDFAYWLKKKADE